MATEFRQQLISYCDASVEELLGLKDQISKIIEIKKKAVNSNSGITSLIQTGDALKTIENMEKIGSKLEPAVDKIKTICQQARGLFEGNEEGLHHEAPSLTQKGS
jgi:hypothetical protein